jgi:hypothetical protein
MNAQPEVTVELLIKLTGAQIDLWRSAISGASTEEQSKKSAKLFFQNLRASGARYTVRELGRAEPKVHSGVDPQDQLRSSAKLNTGQQSDRRQHGGYNGVI